MKRWKRIKVKASYFLDEPEKWVNADELVKNRLYRFDNNQLCDGEGNRFWPVPVNGQLEKFS